MAKKDKKVDVAALKTLTGAGGTGYLPQAKADELKTAGLVDVHETLKDSAGNPAVRLREAGNKLIASASTGENKVTEPTQPISFAIDSDVEMPARRAGGGAAKGSRYPFDKLEVGHSFHIPVTAEVPEPWRKYSSIASGATKRYAEKVVDAAGAPIMETKSRKSKDKATGVVSEKSVTAQKTKNTRVFSIRPAKADDKRGPGARVFRTA